MNALKLKPDLDASLYVQQSMDMPALDAIDVLQPAAPAETERRRQRSRMTGLRLARASEDEFHLFRIY
jgi:hypothetical protein